MLPLPANVQKLEPAATVVVEDSKPRVPLKILKRWQPDEKTVLKKMWLSGSSIEEIVAALPGRTYAMVSVKAHREGLPMRKNRPHDEQYTPLFELTMIEKIDTPAVPKILKSPNCLGPCGQPFRPAHKMQRMCLKCKELVRQMCL